ncbi:MAG TPA: class D sortase [Thermoanaerobaculia bacterium]|jgi:LPXTG-site transpeptidase (sortase) family protein|nr:class D sortase [Thermoanaerobaculia bacterium]
MWAERILLAIGILCLGIFVWSWLDARLYEREQNARLEQALARPAAETDSFESLRKGAERAQEKRDKQKPPPPAPELGEMVGRVSIPRLGVSAIVLEGVDKKALRRGAGHIPATALPEQEEGNVGIAAHRDSFFRGLKDIQEDDTIEMTTLDGTFRYEVEWTKIVKPADVSVLEPTDEPVLTLVTCYPFYFVGSAPKRFIVRARKIPEIPKEESQEWLVDVDTE